jgi:hypothetical protein
MDTAGQIVPLAKNLRETPLASEVVFFKTPQNIGTLLWGYSDFYRKSPTRKKPMKRTLWIRFLNLFSYYKYENIFIGTGGAAYYKMEYQVDNIIEEAEVEFKGATDLFSYRQDIYRNFVYMGSILSCFLYNRDTNSILFQIAGDCSKKSKSPFEYKLDAANCLEASWTMYMREQLIKDIDKYFFENGSLSFLCYNEKTEKIEKFVKLELGKITFLQGENAPFTYLFDEIKRAYVKEGELFIEHKNYKKEFIFFSSGNKNSLPIKYLLNRTFFIYALSKLLGNIFSEE